MKILILQIIKNDLHKSLISFYCIFSLYDRSRIIIILDNDKNQYKKQNVKTIE